jgi:hypothetical protein
MHRHPAGRHKLCTCRPWLCLLCLWVCRTRWTQYNLHLPPMWSHALLTSAGTPFSYFITLFNAYMVPGGCIFIPVDSPAMADSGGVSGRGRPQRAHVAPGASTAALLPRTCEFVRAKWCAYSTQLCGNAIKFANRLFLN